MTTPYILYADPGFAGSEYDGRADIPDFRLTNFGYKASALKVFPGYAITIFSEANYAGNKLRLQGPNFMKDITYTGFNDNIKSLRLEKIGPIYQPTKTQVTAIATQKGPLNNMKYSMCGKDTICRTTNTLQDGTVPANSLDWKVSKAKCSFPNGDSRYCSPMDAGVCPAMKSTADSAFWLNPAQPGDDSGRDIQCGYDLAQFDNPDSLATFRDHAWKNRDDALRTFSRDLMPNYCGQQVTTCPVDPITGQPMSACSRFVSNGRDGDICRKWVTDGLNNVPGFQEANSYADNAMSGYCRKYNTPDCSCLNRTQDPDFRAITNLSNTGAVNASQTFGKDSCWWKPCQHPDQILRSSDLYPKPNDCNIQLCQFLVDVRNNNLSTININKIDSVQKCDFSGGKGQTQSVVQTNTGQVPLQPGSSTGVTSTPTGTVTRPPTSTSTTTNTGGGTRPTTTVPTTGTSSRTYWIIGIIVAIIIILLIIGLLIYFSRRNKAKKVAAAAAISQPQAITVGG